MARLTRLLTAVVLAGAAGVASAGIDVFTTAGDPVVDVPDGAHVVEIDRARRLDRQLSHGLPAKRRAAAAIVRQRLDRFKTRYRQAYRGLIHAWRLGVNKVPAVVVGGRYVVYGQTDVGRAVARIKRYRHNRSAP